MNTMETLLDEVRQAPPAMLEEVLDFVRFLKSGRFAPSGILTTSSGQQEPEVVFAYPRSLAHLAEEQRTFAASISVPLIDVELPSEE